MKPSDTVTQVVQDQKPEDKFYDGALAEIRAQRESLESQFKLWVGLLLAIAGILGASFTYLYGNSLERVQDTLEREVETAVVEYRLVEAYQRRLEQRFQIAAESSEVSQQIADEVERRVKAEMGSLIATELNLALKDRTGSSLEAIVADASLGRLTTLEDTVADRQDALQDLLILLASQHYPASDELGRRKQLLIDQELCRYLDSNVAIGTLECSGAIRQRTWFMDRLHSLPLDENSN